MLVRALERLHAVQTTETGRAGSLNDHILRAQSSRERYALLVNAKDVDRGTICTAIIKNPMQIIPSYDLTPPTSRFCVKPAIFKSIHIYRFLLILDSLMPNRAAAPKEPESPLCSCI